MVLLSPSLNHPLLPSTSRARARTHTHTHTGTMQYGFQDTSSFCFYGNPISLNVIAIK